jgi:hypothetical protein
LQSAVINYRSEELDAMVVMLEGRVTDAIGETPRGVTKGIEVLDELASIEVNSLEVIKVDSRVARALPAYWRASGAAREVVQSFIQPGRRGAIVVNAPGGTGVMLFDEEGVVASYRDGESKPGGDALDELLADPNVVLSARADAMPQRSASLTSPNTGGERPAPAPTAPPRPAPTPPPARPPQPATSPIPPPPPTGPPPGMPPAPTGGAQPYGSQVTAELETRREAIINMVRARLGRLSGPVEQLFQAARSLEDLSHAAGQVRNMQLRMVNPLTLQSISEDATVIARGEPARG